LRVQKLLLGAGLLLAAASPALARDVVIDAGTLIDGAYPTPRQRMSILIKNDRMTSVSPGFVAPIGAEVIDLTNATVMPGFIDAHVPIAAKLPSSTNMVEDWLTHFDIDRAFGDAKFGAAMLQQGFTAAHDVGGGPDRGRCAMPSIVEKLPGPGCGYRLWLWDRPQAMAMRVTAWTRSFRIRVGTTVSSIPPDQARTKILEHKRRGADLIKIMPSGGIASSGDNPRQKLMDDDEIIACAGRRREKTWRMLAWGKLQKG